MEGIKYFQSSKYYEKSMDYFEIPRGCFDGSTIIHYSTYELIYLEDSITVLDYLAVIGLYGLSAITMYTAGVISLLILAFVIPVKEAKRRKLLNILFPLIPVFRPIMNNLPHGQRVWFESKI